MSHPSLLTDTLHPRRDPGRIAAATRCLDPCEPVESARGPVSGILPAGDPLLPVAGVATRRLVETLGVFAAQHETVLLTGPTGAGKSRLAEWCHARSPRRAGPFQIVDLLSVPEEMQMAEIFGWKRGAFTGAHQDQDGCIAKSDGGTLFIDEVDKLSLRAQAGLLHLFETRRYRVLGDAGRLRPADVRFVVATSADLRAEVARGRFREDLYFRINVLPVRVPPLSERRDEIAGWARFILERRHREVRPDGVVRLSPEAERALVQLPWPGNIRQLDNVVRRAYALASGDDPTSGWALALEREHVERALSLESEGPELPPLMASLRGAAADFIEHAIRRCEVGEPLSLDLTAAFRGLVLEAGVRRLGDLREVFRVVGCDAVLRSRNHTREYRRELAKIARVEEMLSAPPKPRDDPLAP